MTRLVIRLITAGSILNLVIGLTRGSLIELGCGVAGLAGAAMALRQLR
jgi:hypothetical protein